MLLTVTNLSKSYGDNQVLANVALTMQRGDKWGLVGANGVGIYTRQIIDAFGLPAIA